VQGITPLLNKMLSMCVARGPATVNLLKTLQISSESGSWSLRLLHLRPNGMVRGPTFSLVEESSPCKTDAAKKDHTGCTPGTADWEGIATTFARTKSAQFASKGTATLIGFWTGIVARESESRVCDGFLPPRPGVATHLSGGLQ